VGGFDGAATVAPAFRGLFDALPAIDYIGVVTEIELATRISTRAVRTRTRTVQAWPALDPAFLSSETALNVPSAQHGNVAQLPDCGETVGGHCVLRALLGEGAFGRVFAAEDEQTGQQVALKVMGLRRYPQEYAEHELRALAAIAHPNVVQLNEHGVEAHASEPYLWYTMPLYKGSDLAASLRNQGNLSLRQAHAVFTRIAGGVCEMHALGLRHQDIKPDNIYLASMAGVAEHHPVLLDLGGAALENTSRPLVATFPFAAPEQTEALIGGLLGDEHAPLSERVDVYALAATLLFALIGAQFAGHDIAQNESGAEASPAALLELRAGLAEVHAVRASSPLPAGALPHITGPARARLSAAFARWLSLDPTARPTARGFVEELSVLLEWDEEVARRRAARELRGTLMRVAAGLSLAVCAGGFLGYQWHKRSMGEAHRATSAALKKADRASDELNRASSNLDKIINDPALGAVDKARKITEVVTSLEAETARLLAANAQLSLDQKAAEGRARLLALQERAAFDTALGKAEAERDAARSAQTIAEGATWKAEAERDQARGDQAAADAARAKAEQERTKSQQEQAAAESARSRAEAESSRSRQEKAAVETERDRAEQSKSADVAAAYEKGVAAGSASRSAPVPAGSN
jgi:eukaryotic-like serine/threonine-protein kinase